MLHLSLSIANVYFQMWVSARPQRFSVTGRDRGHTHTHATLCVVKHTSHTLSLDTRGTQQCMRGGGLEIAIQI